MTGVALTSSHVQQWNCENNTKRYNLCEVCLKPFNLANIDMHLEAGCAAEIYNRYNITPVEVSTKKKSKKVKTSRKSNKITKKPKTGRKNEKKTQKN